MNKKTTTQKIAIVSSLLAAALIVLMQVRLLFQNYHLLTQRPPENFNSVAMYAKLSVMVFFGVLMFSIVAAAQLIDKSKKPTLFKQLAITSAVFISLNLLLTLIFMNTESKPFLKEFYYASSESRSIAYYVYSPKKFILATMLSVFIIVAIFLDFSKTSKEKVNQAWLYQLAIITIFLNSMFLMVSLLDGLKAKGTSDSFKQYITAGVVLSMLLFFVSFFHFFLGIIQRRAISNDKLNMKKN